MKHAILKYASVISLCLAVIVVPVMADLELKNSAVIRFTDGTTLSTAPVQLPAHTGAIWRWATFHTFDESSGWFAGNDAALFGGVPPEWWTDGDGLASEMSGNKEVLRTLLTRKGYGGVTNGMVVADSWYSNSSTNGQVTVALFRIRNTTGSPITWISDFYYSAYPTWNETASVALNGVLAWDSGATSSGGNETQAVALSIPGNQTSSVLFVSPSGPPSTSMRSNVLIFRNDSLALAAGLEYVDDLDVASDPYYRDDDGDGYGQSNDWIDIGAPSGAYTATVGGDCDDSNSSINPGAAEVCGDGIDNNCDGSIDEACQRYYLDLDGDGYGVSNDWIDAGAPSGAYTATVGGDCDDSNSSINPGAVEVCGDGIDNNCDGFDEAC